METLEDTRRLSAAATSSLDFNNESTNVNNGSTSRNSASYSSYKLIKNSQSSLMPSANKSIIDQPLLLAPVVNLNKQQQQHNQQDDMKLSMYMDSKLAQQKSLHDSPSTSSNSSIQHIQNKFTNFNLSQQQLQFKKELDSKLSGQNENGHIIHEEDNLNQNINLKYFLLDLFFNLSKFTHCFCESITEENFKIRHIKNSNKKAHTQTIFFTRVY